MRAPETTPLEAWLHSSSSAVHAFLSAQRRALALLEAPLEDLSAAPPRADLEARLRALRRDPANVVLSSVRALEDGDLLRGTLAVREDHPYFFDHPLDHVPGILLLEGLLQMVECAAPRRSLFVRSAAVTFRRFCEKARPAVLEVRVERGGGRFSGRVIQDGEVTCAAAFEAAGTGPLRAPPLGSARVEPVREVGLLHKRRPENVLVGPLTAAALAADRFVSRLVSPPRAPIFLDGDPAHLSMLYLLEATRQVAMLVAHSLEGVPLGMPMNLLGARVSVARPVLRGEALEMRYVRGPGLEAGGAAPADICLTIADSSGALGEAAIRAQVVDPDTYRRQRGAEVRA